MANLQNNVLEMASDALNWTDEAIQNFTSLASLPEPLDCKPGCYHCCHNLPMVTPPEALLIGNHIDQKFTDQKKNEIIRRVNKILKHINGINPYEIVMMRHELPCIFLEDGLCMVYPVRPAICRTCTSTSSEHCKMIFENRDHRARLRCYQRIREIFDAVHSRLVNHCREMGCQADPMPLAKTMRDYFKHTYPIDAWLAGETVFRISL